MLGMDQEVLRGLISMTHHKYIRRAIKATGHAYWESCKLQGWLMYPVGPSPFTIQSHDDE